MHAHESAAPGSHDSKGRSDVQPAALPGLRSGPPLPPGVAAKRPAQTAGTQLSAEFLSLGGSEFVQPAPAVDPILDLLANEPAAAADQAVAAAAADLAREPLGDEFAPLADPGAAPRVDPSQAAPADVVGTDANDAASAPTPIVERNLTPRQLLESWIIAMVEAKASDLILRAGGRPCCRIDGKIQHLSGRVPTSGAMLELLEGTIGKRSMEQWRERGAVDTALALDGLGRFRLNAYRQLGEPAVVLRRIASDAPDIEKLCLPSAELKRMALRKRGIILVTGIAGSGKSTTLAAMIQYMNRHAERHIVTLEDPIEMMFTEARCVISQREIGLDCMSFAEGLRHSLRQSPDVILIGEMRDAETVSAALDATETGHLVMSTLHTVNAGQTLDRILGFFPSEQHKQICIRLAANLAGVLSQRLVPRAQGRGMVPACELMTSTPRVRELLEKGNTIEISRAVDSGTEPGLMSFNQSLRALVEQGLVDVDIAMSASDRPEELMLALRGFKNGNVGERGKLRMGGS